MHRKHQCTLAKSQRAKQSLQNAFEAQQLLSCQPRLNLRRQICPWVLLIVVGGLHLCLGTLALAGSRHNGLRLRLPCQLRPSRDAGLPHPGEACTVAHGLGAARHAVASAYHANGVAAMPAESSACAPRFLRPWHLAHQAGRLAHFNVDTIIHCRQPLLPQSVCRYLDQLSAVGCQLPQLNLASRLTFLNRHGKHCLTNGPPIYP
mmetsp:Transcript_102618/g.257197  ORF Transcript_102618/g.257197 Transcript_102618/m.257197 type:complete len:205 (+) Transcript_102618:133-747(+)